MLTYGGLEDGYGEGENSLSRTELFLQGESKEESKACLGRVSRSLKS